VTLLTSPARLITIIIHLLWLMTSYTYHLETLIFLLQQHKICCWHNIRGHRSCETKKNAVNLSPNTIIITLIHLRLDSIGILSYSCKRILISGLIKRERRREVEAHRVVRWSITLRSFFPAISTKTPFLARPWYLGERPCKKHQGKLSRKTRGTSRTLTSLSQIIKLYLVVLFILAVG
jgi:hypothetical protein